MLPDGIMSSLSSGYDQLWKAMIQPPRHTYHLEDLGPTKIYYDNGVFCRDDFTLDSGNSGKVAVSFFRPDGVRDTKQMPCVVYLHSQGGCRLEGKFLIERCLSQGISLCLFDFLGCGRSEGQYVSLGHFEHLQVERVINHLTDTYSIGSVGLWGRSMGAVTAILYAKQNSYRVNSMVLDSPFSSLKKLVQDLAYEHFNLPSFISGIGVSILSSSVESRLGVDLFEVLDPFTLVGDCRTPVLFLVGSEDVMVKPKRVNQLCQRYGASSKPVPSKFVLECSGGHISTREESTVTDAFQLLLLQARQYIRTKESIDRKLEQMMTKTSRPKKAQPFGRKGTSSNPAPSPYTRPFTQTPNDLSNPGSFITSPGDSNTSSFVSQPSSQGNVAKPPASTGPRRGGLLRSSTQHDGLVDAFIMKREGIAPGPKKTGLQIPMQVPDSRQRFRTKSFCELIPQATQLPANSYLSVNHNQPARCLSRPGSGRQLNTSFVSQKGSTSDKAHDTSTAAGSHASFHEESTIHDNLGSRGGFPARQLYKSKQNSSSGYITILPNFYFPN